MNTIDFEKKLIEKAKEHGINIKKNPIPLVVHYSFDSEVPVYFFDTEEDAKAELKLQFEEEKRIELEENERVEGEDVRFDVADDWSWASITVVVEGNEPDDVTEWAIGNVYPVPVRKTHYEKSDDLQWVKKEDDGSFSLVEVRLMSHEPDQYSVVAGNIDLSDYAGEDDLDSLVSGYYESIADVREKYPDDWEQIVAECIFEQTADCELIGFGPYDSEDEAEKAAEEYVKVQEANHVVR